MTEEQVFMGIGFIGQGIFGIRFIIQWAASERAKKSVIPFSFWIISIVASLFSLIYAIYKKDPVFIMGQIPNIFVYSRNIFLMKKRTCS